MDANGAVDLLKGWATLIGAIYCPVSRMTKTNICAGAGRRTWPWSGRLWPGG